MKWNEQDFERETRKARGAGLNIAAEMLETAGRARRQAIEQAVKTGHVCVQCGAPLIEGDDYVALPSGLYECMTATCKPEAVRARAVAQEILVRGLQMASAAQEQELLDVKANMQQLTTSVEDAMSRSQELERSLVAARHELRSARERIRELEQAANPLVTLDPTTGNKTPPVDHADTLRGLCDEYATGVFGHISATYSDTLGVEGGTSPGDGHPGKHVTYPASGGVVQLRLVEVTSGSHGSRDAIGLHLFAGSAPLVEMRLSQEHVYAMCARLLWLMRTGRLLYAAGRRHVVGSRDCTWYCYNAGNYETSLRGMIAASAWLAAPEVKKGGADAT